MPSLYVWGDISTNYGNKQEFENMHERRTARNSSFQSEKPVDNQFRLQGQYGDTYISHPLF